MARNNTTRSYELSLQWDNSIDYLTKGSPYDRNRLQLASPKQRVASPLKKYEVTELYGRRKLRKWATLEEDTLRTVVEKYAIACI